MSKIVVQQAGVTNPYARDTINFTGIATVTDNPSNDSIDIVIISARGTVTLVAGSATIPCPSITSTSHVSLTNLSNVNQGFLHFTLNPTVGFTITSSSGTDGSVVAYAVIP